MSTRLLFRGRCQIEIRSLRCRCCRVDVVPSSWHWRIILELTISLGRTRNEKVQVLSMSYTFRFPYEQSNLYRRRDEVSLAGLIKFIENIPNVETCSTMMRSITFSLPPVFKVKGQPFSGCSCLRNCERRTRLFHITAR